MALSIYKKGQGYWTRVMTAIAAGLLIVMGANWQWGIVGGFNWPFQPVYAAMGGAVLIVAIFGWMTYLYVGLKPKTVDFLVATEGEMKKVNLVLASRSHRLDVGRDRPDDPHRSFLLGL